MRRERFSHRGFAVGGAQFWRRREGGGGKNLEDLPLLLSCTNCSLFYVAFSPCDPYLWPFIRMSPSLGSAKPFLLGPRRSTHCSLLLHTFLLLLLFFSFLLVQTIWTFVTFGKGISKGEYGKMTVSLVHADPHIAPSSSSSLPSTPSSSSSSSHPSSSF